MARHDDVRIVNVYSLSGHLTVEVKELDTSAVETSVVAGGFAEHYDMGVLYVHPAGHDPHAGDPCPLTEGSITIAAAPGVTFSLHGCRGWLYGPGNGDEQIELTGEPHRFTT